jgi:hypothetical protein
MKHCVFLAIGLLAVAPAPLGGCSSGNRSTPPKEAGVTDSSSSSGGDSGPVCPAGGGLRAFTPPDASKLTAGQLLLTASGESLAQTGYNFPDTPANGVFADGWEVRFTHFIATFDKVTLSQNPDKVPTDQSQTDGPVAEGDGPWAIDLSKPTPNDIAGKEMGETATPFAVLTGQNLVSGNPTFSTTAGTKYAVGFSAVVADPCAINVNLDAEAQALYGQMVTQGCAVLYVGTATFKADPAMCTTQDPEFSLFPQVVNFSFCFKSPTQYINCDNQDTAGTPFGAEPHPRGIQFTTNSYVTGEVTFHTDHPFWESVIHDVPPHFDQFAARVAYARVVGGADGGPDAGGPPGVDAGIATVTLDDVVGVDYLAYTDENGNPVQWRSCVKDATGMPYGKSSGRMSFDPQSVPKTPPGPSPTTAGLRDYYDFTTYNQSTQGHWNGTDGLCFVKRNYPAPP